MKNTNGTGPKRDRFVRVVERRVNKVLADLDSLGRCANKKNYDYGEEDVKKIFAGLEKKLRDIKGVYQNALSQSTTFKL